MVPLMIRTESTNLFIFLISDSLLSVAVLLAQWSIRSRNLPTSYIFPSCQKYSHAFANIPTMSRILLRFRKCSQALTNLLLNIPMVFQIFSSFKAVPTLSKPLSCNQKDSQGFTNLPFLVSKKFPRVHKCRNFSILELCSLNKKRLLRISRFQLPYTASDGVSSSVHLRFTPTLQTSMFYTSTALEFNF